MVSGPVERPVKVVNVWPSVGRRNPAWLWKQVKIPYDFDLAAVVIQQDDGVTGATLSLGQGCGCVSSLSLVAMGQDGRAAGDEKSDHLILLEIVQNRTLDNRLLLSSLRFLRVKLAQDLGCWYTWRIS
jgi:hypothetical protein